MRFRILLVSVLARALRRRGPELSTTCASPLAQNNFSAAESELKSYRAQAGVTPNTWKPIRGWARARWTAKQYDQAAAYAKQTKTLALEQLKKRSLDAEPHLPLALGAALEVQSQALAARGQRTQAIAVLQSALRTYGNTSIHDRLQKNLNLLSLAGEGRRRR